MRRWLGSLTTTFILTKILTTHSIVICYLGCYLNKSTQLLRLSLHQNFAKRSVLNNRELSYYNACYDKIQCLLLLTITFRNKNLGNWNDITHALCCSPSHSHKDSHQRRIQLCTRNYTEKLWVENNEDKAQMSEIPDMILNLDLNSVLICLRIFKPPCFC